MLLLLSISGFINLVAICTLVWVFRRPRSESENRWNMIAQAIEALRGHAAQMDNKMAAMESELSAMARGRSRAIPVTPADPGYESISIPEPISKSLRNAMPATGPAIPPPVTPQRIDLSTVQPILDYNKARSMTLEEGEQWFSDRYPDLRRISCINRSNVGSRQSDLRFQFSSRGAFLAVAYRSELLLFPLLTDKYAIARGILEGVFLYPLESLDKLRLRKPALVERDADGSLVLAKDGHGEFESPTASQLKTNGQGVIDLA